MTTIKTEIPQISGIGGSAMCLEAAIKHAPNTLKALERTVSAADSRYHFHRYMREAADSADHLNRILKILGRRLDPIDTPLRAGPEPNDSLPF